MKKALVILATGVSIFMVTWIGPVKDGAEVSALSGCCKQRDSYKDNWHRNGQNFIECQAANQQDGDNIFEEAGLIWWDRSC